MPRQAPNSPLLIRFVAALVTCKHRYKYALQYIQKVHIALKNNKKKKILSYVSKTHSSSHFDGPYKFLMPNDYRPLEYVVKPKMLKKNIKSEKSTK